jgi:outer membrane lipoprotein SlyB
MRATHLLALTLVKTAAEVPFYEDPSNIGAAAGAAIGGSGAALLSKKNKWRNALIAALAGGAAGYVAGPHVDKAVPQIREGLGALSGAGARALGKQGAASRADFDGNAVGTSPDFLEALGAKMAPSSATAPRRTPAPVVKPKMKPVQVTGQKTAQEAPPATPFYKDPANIGAVTGAALAGGGAALLSKKNKWRNALLAALAGGAAGYVAGPHVDKAVPQIREGLGSMFPGDTTKGGGSEGEEQQEQKPPQKPLEQVLAESKQPGARMTPELESAGFANTSTDQKMQDERYDRVFGQIRAMGGRPGIRLENGQRRVLVDGAPAPQEFQINSFPGTPEPTVTPPAPASATSGATKITLPASATTGNASVAPPPPKTATGPVI